MKKYDAEYFLRKFDAIPEDCWAVRKFVDSEGRKCVLGHCGTNDVVSLTTESSKLNNLFRKSLKISPMQVNDDGVFVRLQLGDTPKERIMNALILIHAGVTL